ncbi:cysteine--tRNA ligase [Aneurinibacillus thermoaerophilus]|uniref:Cysteine--tRNA ligase n=1 Tax=Aneurinibacillus thermoaerophilus TaxID=143495 RepID=A0A1G8CW55_ANETH|nr:MULTISPECIES: cysteine--tRNA ligase [Aneurinibacillus]AMA74473.1 cysteine--tRNA ligase [Aneurinibacillus sp. XH2]MED0677296.1 cysteine--tRNA ligase [Aneurinibacillus thermoaerophilus]MED0757830.1 cysteine--tRNA ligase [Aneurinibacillus thermoaerophilus]MED0761994.1 cysteine--tRNA ligase [Aneurinibacillus thermoaerophilus]SDH49200.1 cysteinyl-tRNA synthetase [Aneurinibacillus thermoaerophilus]
MSSIKIYNTLTRKKEEFVPLEAGKVKMYVCGPTVYNFIHIGNARPPIVFDVVRRYFSYRGYEVTYVQNFTDVDDKIIKKAEESGMGVEEVANMFIAAFEEDVRALGVKKADVHPKVTEHIPEIIAFIEDLIAKGHAYVASGDVYFRTASFAEYGKLSYQNIEELQAGARIEVSDKKENPLDFVLWKGAKPGEICWESPWGKGRPGWHIECSAMSMKYLGETFDIHGGGHDLIFPHHENEIAQTESLTGHPMAKYWMHNGYINIENEKMSKSLGNVILVKKLRENYPARVIRFFMLGAHYRNPINFSDALLRQAANALERIDTAVRNLKHHLDSAVDEAATEEEKQRVDSFRQRFIEEMDNDFNTADAITVLFDMVREVNQMMAANVLRKEIGAAYLALFAELGDVLGITFGEAEQNMSGPSDEEINTLIEERAQARKVRNFARADEIRNRLQEMGIIIEDTPQGTRWHRK